MSETFYRPGLIFTSPYSAYQFIARRGIPNYGPDGVTIVSEVRELLAEFAMHRGEFSYIDHEGNTQVAADIAGHFFDLDAQAEQKGWTAEEKEIVAMRLLQACQKFPGEVALHTKAPAPKPWPKYDETHVDAIPLVAEQTGTVAEAIAYEKENQDRKKLVAALEKLLASVVEEETELAAV